MYKGSLTVLINKQIIYIHFRSYQETFLPITSLHVVLDVDFSGRDIFIGPYVTTSSITCSSTSTAYCSRVAQISAELME